MKKLDFLVGKWSGEARVQYGSGNWLELIQSEDAQYKLDGLVLLIEGTGRNKPEGKAVFQALATVSYDEEAGAYRMRAYNDGRYLETELKLTEEKGFTWGFAFGQIKTRYVMRINEKGEWTEVGEVILDEQPPRKFYTFRRTCITRWAKYMDPFTLHVLAGHTDVNTTKRYVHPSEADIREAMERVRSAVA